MKNYYRRSYAYALTFALFFTYNSPIFSQNQPLKTISGIITDAEGPLGGVNVLVKNSARGSISDLEGRYSLSVSPTDTLVFTYVGYKLREVAVGSSSIMNVKMEVDAQALDAVVINAGYYKVSDREKTGSITRVTAAEIENQPVSNPLAAMQGRMAGVNIVQTTGVPGGGFSVHIRGRNSIRADGSEPLYIVDGVPYPSQSLGDSRVSTVLGYVPQSPLNGINPNDIESIEVLKDADATAIYGSRGANGVVLITTKKGKGGKTTFEIGSSTGVGKIKHRMELLNTQQYLSMRREAFANDGIMEYPSFDYDINGTWDQNRYTDWQDELLGGTAYYNNAHASVQGGNEQTRFLVKGSYGEQSTVLPGDYKYKKSSILLNLNHSTADDKFSIQISGNYVVDKNNYPATNLVREALTLPPNAPALYNENGELNWEDNTFDNPLAALNAKYKSNANYLRANTVLSYTPFKGFGLKANLGYFATSLEETRTAPHTIYKPSFGLDSSYSILTINNGDLSSWIIEPQATYTLGLGKGVLDILVGTTLQNDNAGQLFQSARDFPNNTVIYNAAAAAIHTIESDTEEMYRYRALFGRINFNWDKKYIVNLTARRDGSSRFGAENRFANFGAVGAAYIFSEEPFMAKVFPFINFGKLRASYGTTGNDQIGNYGYLNTYTTNGLSYQGNQTLSPVQLYNPDFSWETNRKLEAAIELGILNDRIMLSTSYYRNRSSSQLVGIPLPGTTGFTSIQSNLDATVQNTGLEFELNTVNLKTDSFTWNTSINLTIPKNKLLSFPQLENSTYANQYVVGQPLDIQLLYQSTGVDPQTGVYTFLDVDGDGIISNPNDRKAIRDVGPKFYGGLSNSITYKMFQLDFLFQLVKQEARNYLSDTPFPGIMRNQPTAILDQWQNPGDDASIQLFSAGYNNEAYLAYINSYNATGAIGDASFVRLKNIALSYNLPSQISTNVDCRIFLTGQNLFTITKYLGPDPETLSIGNLPPLSVLTMGVEFKI
jgi:TonB-linked SusC/RagA family outer membrane protein